MQGGDTLSGAVRSTPPSRSPPHHRRSPRRALIWKADAAAVATRSSRQRREAAMLAPFGAPAEPGGERTRGHERGRAWQSSSLVLGGARGLRVGGAHMHTYTRRRAQRQRGEQKATGGNTRRFHSRKLTGRATHPCRPITRLWRPLRRRVLRGVSTLVIPSRIIAISGPSCLRSSLRALPRLERRPTAPLPAALAAPESPARSVARRVASFVPNGAMRTVAPASCSIAVQAKVGGLIGDCAPLGFFDPLGFSKEASPETMKK